MTSKILENDGVELFKFDGNGGDLIICDSQDTKKGVLISAFNIPDLVSFIKSNYDIKSEFIKLGNKEIYYNEDGSILIEECNPDYDCSDLIFFNKQEACKLVKFLVNLYMNV